MHDFEGLSTLALVIIIQKKSATANYFGLRATRTTVIRSL